MTKIIGLGNALVDVLVQIDDDNVLESISLPKGSMQLIDETKFLEINKILSRKSPSIATGGSAANTIKALATLEANVGFLGKIGKDSYGDFFKSTFQEHGINTHLLVEPCKKSGVASTFISSDGERTFGTHLGAASELLEDDIIESIFREYEVLYIEGYLVQNHDLILKSVKLAKEMGLKVCIDLASYNIVSEDLDFFRFLVRNYVDIVFANQEEAYAFSQQTEDLEALKFIGCLCDIVVMKIGADGSYVMFENEIMKIEAIPDCKVVDTTGAGDYFAAGFLYGYINGLHLVKCAEIGSLLSAYVIEVIGTTLSKDTWVIIKNKIQDIIN